MGVELGRDNALLHAPDAGAVHRRRPARSRPSRRSTRSRSCARSASSPTSCCAAASSRLPRRAARARSRCSPTCEERAVISGDRRRRHLQDPAAAARAGARRHRRRQAAARRAAGRSRRVGRSVVDATASIPRPRSTSRWSASTSTSPTAYKSLNEALMHAGIQTRTRVNIALHRVRETSRRDGTGALAGRGRDPRARRLRRARHRRQDRGGALRARERRCRTSASASGMQVAIIEYARHVVGLAGANSTEFEPQTPHPGDRADHRMAGPRRHGASARRRLRPRRHDAPGRAGRASSRPARSRTRSTARRDHRSAIATATSSTIAT